MKKLFKVIINHSGCKKYSTELLNGDPLLITHADPYITSDVDELRHLGNQTFLKIIEVDDKDYKMVLLDTRYLPEVKRILSINDAKEFLWKDEQEDMVIEKLKEHGYLVEKEESIAKDPIDLSDEALIAILKERGYVGIRKGRTSASASKDSNQKSDIPIISDDTRDRESF